MMDTVRPTKFCSQNIVFISFSDHGHAQKKRNNSYTEFGGGGGLNKVYYRQRENGELKEQSSQYSPS